MQATIEDWQTQAQAAIAAAKAWTIVMVSWLTEEATRWAPLWTRLQTEAENGLALYGQWLRDRLGTDGIIGAAVAIIAALLVIRLLLERRPVPDSSPSARTPKLQAEPVVTDLIGSLRRRRDDLADGLAVDRAAARHAVERAVALEEQHHQLVDLVLDLTRLKTARPTLAAAVDAAIAGLRAGSTEAAEALLGAVETAPAEPDQALPVAPATLARHQGALAFLHDTGRALTAYRRAVELDPRDPDAWNQLGTLLLQTGDTEGALAACQTVMALGQPAADQGVMAVAVGNLGLIYRRRGDLDRAEEHFRISLAFFAATGRREGMARQFGNLGQIHQARGQLERAEELFRKALAVNEGLGRGEGMAGDYGNLGLVRKLQGDIDGACWHWSRARDLYAGLGMTPMVRLVEDMIAAALPRTESPSA